VLFQKFVDLLDLFGIIWFAVGNLLLFNNTKCAGPIPLTYSVGVAFIIATYLYVSTPVMIKFTLGTCPPHDNEGDIVPWMRGYLAPQDVRDGASQLSPDQHTRWQTWLNGFNCTEYEYHAEDQVRLFENIKTPDDGDDSMRKGGKDEPEGEEICSICLQSFCSPPLSPTNASLSRGLPSSILLLRSQPLSIPSASLQPSSSFHHAVLAHSPSRNSSPSSGSRTSQSQVVPSDTDDIRQEEVEMVETVVGDDTSTTPDVVPTISGCDQSTNIEAAANMVVSYPCDARHVFHVSCLHSWLQVCFESAGVESRLTCPVCRQFPKEINGPPSGSMEIYRLV